jgi:DNA-binding MarR family transcriptional regulator
VNAAFDLGAAQAPVSSCDGPGAEAARRAGADLDRLVELWQSLRGALQAIDHTVKTVSGDERRGLAHWLLLLQLGRRSPVPQSQLRRSTDMDSGFLTRLLDELDSRKLVQRRRDHADRRQVLLSITQQGSAALRTMLTSAGSSGRIEALHSCDGGSLQRLAASFAAADPQQARRFTTLVAERVP